jgi:hypothetical protein
MGSHRARRRGTSLSGLVRQLLRERMAEQSYARAAAHYLSQLPFRLASGQQRQPREDLHDRAELR